MGARLGDHLLAGLGVQADGNLIAHGAGGNEQGCFAGKCLGGATLKKVDRGVFPVNIVAHLGRGHGGAHLRAGASDSIGAEVDHRFSLEDSGQRSVVFYDI